MNNVTATIVVSGNKIGTRLDGVNREEMGAIMSGFHAALLRWPRYWDGRLRLWLLPQTALDATIDFYRSQPNIKRVLFIYRLGRQMEMNFETT